MENDFHPPRNYSQHQKHKRRQRLAFMLTGAVILAAASLMVFFNKSPNGPLAATENQEDVPEKAASRPPREAQAAVTTSQTEAAPQGQAPSAPEAAPTQGQSSPEPPATNCRTIKKTLQPGQTLTHLVNDYCSPAQIHRLAQACQEVYSLRKLTAGHPYELTLKDSQLQKLCYTINQDEQLIIQRQQGQFQAHKRPIPYDVRTDKIEGRISSSLFQAVHASGENPELAMRLADIFAWDIDFIRDLRQGDRFTVLIEKRYLNDRFKGYGKLLAACFVNQKQPHYAIRFEDAEGTNNAEFYDLEGKSLRKSFLKAPLDYTRISSGYSHRRKHPVLNVYRPHLAIDYAAPTGTPIHAVADGRVIIKSKDRSNGRMVRLQHPNSYQTNYIHMSRFASGLHVGKKVQQGEIIGYVGATGLATGPHLDYRVYKHGHPINPLKIKAEPAAPVPPNKQTAFQQVVKKRLKQMQHTSPIPRLEQRSVQNQEGDGAQEGKS